MYKALLQPSNNLMGYSYNTNCMHDDVTYATTNILYEIASYIAIIHD